MSLIPVSERLKQLFMGSFFIWTTALVGGVGLTSSKAHAVLVTHLTNDQEPLVLEGLFSLPCLLRLEQGSQLLGHGQVPPVGSAVALDEK